MVEKPLCYIYQILAEIDSTIGRQVFKFQHTNIAEQFTRHNAAAADKHVITLTTASSKTSE